MDGQRRLGAALAALVMLLPCAAEARLLLTGRVVDRDSGLPIGGVALRIADRKNPAAPLITIHTQRDGTYWLHVAIDAPLLIAADATPRRYAIFHGLLDARGAQSRVATIRLSRLSTDEGAWLRVLNADRAALHLRPVVMDETALLAAREHAHDMAQHAYFAHNNRSGKEPWQRYSLLSGVGGDYENLAIGEGTTWADIEAAFKAEGPPARAGVCTHYTTLFNPKAVWAGLAIARGGRAAFQTASGKANYFDQELIEYP